MLPLVSVVIPVYNVEPYLCQCLDSVISQTLKDIEIICVDDGSTDNSLNILKEYANKDTRFIILQQENLHAGIARNAGLKIAKGKYIIFLDSDDFFELDMLEKMYNKIIQDDSDMIACGFYRYNDKTGFTKINHIDSIYVEKSPFTHKEIGIDLFNFTTSVPWTKLFKKEIFINNNLKFEDYIVCNDLTCILLAIACCKKISVIDECFVYYRANQNNNLTSHRNKHIDCVLYAVNKIEEGLKRLQLYEEVKAAFLKRIKRILQYELNLCSEIERNKAIEKGKFILSETLYNIMCSL